MKLYLVRHGESENNLKGCYTGWADVSLTEKGVEDAKRIRSFFENKPVDKIYTSDLKRAKQTAEAVIPDCVYEETPVIREINVGDLSYKRFSDCEKIYGEEFKKNKAKINYAPYGGESAEAFTDRVKQFLKILEQSESECVVAFSHGGFLRATLRYIIGHNISSEVVKCTNCTIGVFEYKNGKWLFNSWITPSELK